MGSFPMKSPILYRGISPANTGDLSKGLGSCAQLPQPPKKGSSRERLPPLFYRLSLRD